MAPRLLNIEPRDHGKSVMWSCGYPLWVALTNPFEKETELLPGGGFRYHRGEEELILQVSNTKDLAKTWIKRHKYELTYNDLLIRDWGRQSTLNMRDGKWTDEEILLLNNAFIESLGSGGQARGKHPTRLVIDDLENRSEARNPVIRVKVREYFWQDLWGVVEPKTTVAILGTFVHPQGLLVELFDKEIVPPPGLEDDPVFNQPWVKFKYSAILPDGSALAPEIWSYAHLMLRKSEMPPKIWKAEFMNNPDVSENPIFPPAWFENPLYHYQRKSDDFIKKILPDLRRVSFVDPAAKQKESNDYSAIITLGYKPATNPDIYILEVKRFRKSFLGQLQEALDSWIAWRGVIGFEDIAYQSVLGDTFKTMCEESAYSPQVYLTNYREKKHKGEKAPKAIDKESRAHRVTKYFELGWIKWDPSDPMQQILIDDLKAFPYGDHDDTVDAIVGALWEIDRNLKFKEDKDKPLVQIAIDPETGQPSMAIQHNILPYDLE